MSFQNLNITFASMQTSEWGFWPYFALAMLVAVEGPIATLVGAAAASTGVMRPLFVFLAAMGGNLAADSLWYVLGYMGKFEWLYHLGKRTGIGPERMERLQTSMRKHAIKVLFFAKLSMSLMIPSLIAAGLVKSPWRKWFPAVFSGEILWTGSLVLIGYYGTQAIKRVEQGLEYVLLAGSLAFVIFVYILGRRILSDSADPVIETIKSDHP